MAAENKLVIVVEVKNGYRGCVGRRVQQTHGYYIQFPYAGYRECEIQI